ncbi:MAG: hypothetical protein LBT29_06195 [Flavobacteriaceae bacterium]|jgi:hypothetical protein|nr:hypothetical protein [Flavobacteriaceae bacterium]
MRKAYDTFLQSEVSADLAAIASGFEPYRYECAHCGEEVHLAAVNSKYMVSHFRHLSGNNDVECEEYLSQYETINTDARSRKSKTERAEFYFDINKKMFCVGLRFSEDEINAYEKSSISFEISASDHEKAFFTQPINTRNFAPDVSNMIPIDKFSCNYFLSNTLNDIKRKYEVFKNNVDNIPTFFKMQICDSNYRAKLVRSSVLYTDISYIVVYQNQYWSDMDNQYEIIVDDTFEFVTMGKKFLGKILTIKEKTSNIDSLLSSWGYKLEKPETLMLMWPPASFIDESVLITGDYAYLYSSFELQAHGNINVHSEDIIKVVGGISRVSIKSRTKVYKKNAELLIDVREKDVDSFDLLSVIIESKSTHETPDNNTYFLFNHSGVTPLNKGMTILLTPMCEIKRYISGYLNGHILPKERPTLTGERLLADILAFYKRTETFSWNDFASLVLSQTSCQYIKSCRTSGFINSAAKYFIKEGLI